MKIAHLVSGGEVAGGQLVALELARAAREAGHEVVFVSPAPGEFVERATGDGFGVHVLPLGGALDIRSLGRLRRLLRSEHAALLHTHTHFSLNVLGRLAGRLAGAVVVCHMHIENVFRADRAGRAVQRALDRLTARLCARIIAVSEATRDGLVREGYPARNVVVIHNGIAIERAEPRRPEGVPEYAPLLLQVARLAPVKGQRELVDAVARLEHRDAVAVIAGKDLETDGAFQAELERHAGHLGVGERVLFVGYRRDVRELVAGADVVVLPSWIEGLPLTVLEAMAQARPVVATAVDGTRELVVDGETGLLVPPRDPAALARALDAVLADPDLARRLGEAGRRRVEERFTARAMCERVLAVYADVARTMSP